MSQQDPQVGEVRFRVPLPITIPLVSLLFIGALAYGFSRILLSVEKDAAVAIALVMAANLLGGCWFLATRPKVSGAQMMELALVVIYPVVIGIAIAEFGLIGGAGHEEGGHGAGVEPPSGSGNIISAANVQFDTDTLTFAAGEDVALTFDNQDTVEHNVAIYPDEEAASGQADALFDGEIIGGGSSVDYEISALEAGEYPFQCDLHPAMAGTVTVEEGGGGSEGEGEGGGEEGGEGEE